MYDLKCHPKETKVVPRFHICLDALLLLFEQEKAPVILVRTIVVYLVLYGFVDTSGSGFESTFSIG